MKLHHALVTTLLALPAASAVQAASMNLEPGLWEYEHRMQIPGMPRQMPAQTRQQCVRQADLEKFVIEDEADCEILEHEVSDDAVSWHVRCGSGESLADMRGRLQTHGDHYEGEAEMEIQGPDGQPRTMTMEMRGRRIGDCR